MVRQLWFKFPVVFDRDLKLLLSSMSLRRIAIGFLEVVRAIYFALLGFSPIEIGVLLSLATFVSAIHHITFSILSDRFGRKPFLILGGIFATVRMIVFAVSSNYWVLAFGQRVGGLGEGAFAGQPVVSGYISDKTKLEERSSIFNILAVSNGLAATVGSLMAGLLPYFQSSFELDIIGAHSVLFWIGVFGSVASILFILPLKEAKSVEINEGEKKRKTLKGYSWRVIARYSLVRSTSGVGFGFIQSLLSLYFFLQFAVGGEVLGPIFAGTRFLSVFSYILVPWMLRRFGELHILMASRFVAATAIVLFSITTSFSLAIILVVVFRVVLMFSMPIRQSFATRIVDPSETATAIGVSNSARMGLRTVAPTLAGYMFETISLNMPFITGATLLLANGLLFKVFFNPKKGKKSTIS
jgi:MFS family permease